MLRHRVKMKFIVFLTWFISFVALLPILYNLIRMPLHLLGDLGGYAPNQFLFLLLPFPLAAFTTFVAFSSLLKQFNIEEPKDILLRWFFLNWPVLILIGIVLVSCVTIADYFYTAKAFDRLEIAYAEKALESAKDLRSRIEDSHFSKEDIQKERISIRDEASSGFKSFKTSLESKSISKEDILNIVPAVYMKIVLDAKLQRELKLLNPTSHVLSILQLFSVLVTAFVSLFSIAMIYLAIQDGYSLKETIDSITFSVISFSLYPICYRYFISEMKLITDSVSTIGGDTMSLILIICAAALVLTMDPSRRDFWTTVVRSIPFLIILIPGIMLVMLGPSSLRAFIGIDTNPGSRLTLFVVMLLISSIVVLAVWPRENSV